MLIARFFAISAFASLMIAIAMIPAVLGVH